MNQDGFSLVGVLILSGVISVVSAGTYQLLNQELEVTRIVRMQQRMDMVEKKVVNSGRSRGALRVTAQKNPGTRLSACFMQESCQALGGYEAIDLYDALGQKLSGTYDLSGNPCKKNCPIDVVVESRILCGGGLSTCSLPSEVQSRYFIRRSSGEFFKGRTFKEKQGMSSLATFACPKDRYIRSITSDGQISCDEAFASNNDTSCAPGSAAFGLDAEGFLKCVEIVDYCKVNIGLAAVLDTSASMKSGGAIDKAKLSLGDFIKALRQQDETSFAVFNSRAAVRQGLTSNLGAVVAAIQAEKPSSQTDMVAGLQTGAETLSSYAAGKKLMVFVSDGFHNAQGDPVATAKTLKAQGIRILTVGLSGRADSRVLQQIASSPQDYYNATQASELKKVFEDISSLTCRGL